MDTINRSTKPSRKLVWLLGLPLAFALLVLAADTWSGGHPPLGAVLVQWAIYPTLTGYLSRAFLGSDYFPSFFIMLLGLMEYPPGRLRTPFTYCPSERLA